MVDICKHICPECPFAKKSIPGHIADYTPEQLHQIAVAEVFFPCHLTHDNNITWQTADQYPACRGRIAYADNCFKRFTTPKLKAFQSQITPKDKELALDIFQVVKHHKL